MSWSKFKLCRALFLASWVAFLPYGIGADKLVRHLTGTNSALIWLLIPYLALFAYLGNKVRTFACPACRRVFTAKGRKINIFTRECLSCGYKP